MATAWAKSFHHLAQHIWSNRKAKAYARDLSRTRLLMVCGLAVALAGAVVRLGLGVDGRLKAVHTSR